MRLAICVLSCAIATGCSSSSPSGPTDGGGRARLLRTRFVAFGDSLTIGDAAASYPSLLESQLRGRYASQAPDITVINAGEPAESVVTGVLRFGDALEEHRPEAVLVMEGVNGLAAIGADVSAALIRTMTQTAKARSVRVFISSMLPTIPGRQRSQNVQLLETYNARLREVCVLEGVTYVDLYETLLPEAISVIGSDGLHPTAAGYRRVAEVFFNSIRAQLEER